MFTHAHSCIDIKREVAENMQSFVEFDLMSFKFRSRSLPCFQCLLLQEFLANIQDIISLNFC